MIVFKGPVCLCKQHHPGLIREDPQGSPDARMTEKYTIKLLVKPFNDLLPVHRDSYFELLNGGVVSRPALTRNSEIRDAPAPYHLVVLDRGEAEYRQLDRKSTRLNSSHIQKSRMPSSA